MPLRGESGTAANLTGVFVPGNRTNFPVQAELLFRENRPGVVFKQLLSSNNGWRDRRKAAILETEGPHWCFSQALGRMNTG